MRILIDECLPRQLKIFIPSEHQATTVPEMGWASIKNGALLTLADKHFDVFITSDRHISEQQNLSSLKIPILVVPTNNRKKIGQLASALRQSLAHIEPSEFVINELGSDSERWPKMKLQSISIGKRKVAHVFKNAEEKGRKR